MHGCFCILIFVCDLCFFFFFKQKTAYEMRISDWSSDVCSSDLMAAESGGNVEGSVSGEAKKIHGVTVIGASNIAALMPADTSALFSRNLFNFLRSEARRVGKECVSKCRSRWSPSQKKKKCRLTTHRHQLYNKSKKQNA